MVRGPRDENVLSTGVCSPFRPCNVNQRRRIPRRSYICPYSPYFEIEELSFLLVMGFQKRGFIFFFKLKKLRRRRFHGGR